jgi:hypothetical protein
MSQFMDIMHYIDVLKSAGVLFAPGLTEAEIATAQDSYRIVFPPDLKEFLMMALPISPRWPNWRNPDDPDIRKQLSRPCEGICFDIEHAGFWLDEWGQKPESLHEACMVAKQAIEQTPRLIPIYAHRYIPDRPNLAGNPVFSIWQTDIIYHGANLWNYIENEFHCGFGMSQYEVRGSTRQVEFWSRLVEINDGRV